MKKILILLVGILSLASCDPAEQAFKDFEKFIENLEQNAAIFTKEDWDKASLEYETIEKNISMQKYTDEQLREIGRLKGRYTVQRTKYSIQKSKQNVNDFFMEAGGFMQSIKEGLQDVGSELNE
jgi:hypothetical protein